MRVQMVELLPRLRRFARGLAGNRENGDDLVQAACERALARASQLAPDSRLDSWMFTIIRNLYIDQVRADKLHKNKLETLHPSEESSDYAHLVMEQQIMLVEVEDAMQILSHDHREILMLITVEETSYKEASRILGIPVGTVTSRLIRARKALNEILSNTENEPILEAQS